MSSFSRGFAKTFEGDSISKGIQQGAAERLKAKLKKQEKDDDAERELQALSKQTRAELTASGETIEGEDNAAIDSGLPIEKVRQASQRRKIRAQQAERQRPLTEGDSQEVSAEDLFLSGQAGSLTEAKIMSKELAINTRLAELKVTGTERESEEALAPGELDERTSEELDKIGGTGSTSTVDATKDIMDMNPAVMAWKAGGKMIDFFRGRTKEVTAFDENLTKEIRAMIGRNIGKPEIIKKLKEDGVTEQELKAYMSATKKTTAEALKDFGLKNNEIKKKSEFKF